MCGTFKSYQLKGKFLKSSCLIEAAYSELIINAIVALHSCRLNPTAALDLINSVVNNPRLWQGRDSKQNTLDEDKGRRVCSFVYKPLSLIRIVIVNPRQTLLPEARG